MGLLKTLDGENSETASVRENDENSTKWNVEAENDGFQTESPLLGCDFQIIPSHNLVKGKQTPYELTLFWSSNHPINFHTSQEASYLFDLPSPRKGKEGDSVRVREGCLSWRCFTSFFSRKDTLPETNSSHLKIGLPNRKVVHHFSGAMLNFSSQDWSSAPKIESSDISATSAFWKLNFQMTWAAGFRGFPLGSRHLCFHPSITTKTICCLKHL